MSASENPKFLTPILAIPTMIRISPHLHHRSACFLDYTRNSLNKPSPLSRTSILCFGGNVSYLPLVIPMTSSNSSSLKKYLLSVASTKKINLKSIGIYAKRETVALQLLNTVSLSLQHVYCIIQANAIDLWCSEMPCFIRPSSKHCFKVRRWCRIARNHKGNWRIAIRPF